MIRNAIAYHLPNGWPWDAAATAEYLSRRTFQPCGNLDAETRGFVPPRDETELCHAVQGLMLICLQAEERILPAYVVTEHAEHKAEELERLQGYKPGRKQMEELKEQALQVLLPQAFCRKRRTFAWIDRDAKLMVVDAQSQNRAEDVLEAMRQAFDVLPVAMLRTDRSPASCMADWLASGEPPEGYTIDQECALEAVTEDGATVRYSRHPLDGDDIRNHLAAGKLPTSLALTFDDRVSFVLTERLEFKRVMVLDIVKEQLDQQALDNAAEVFDADFLLTASEIGRLVTNMIERLGGLLEQSGGDLLDEATNVRAAFNKLADTVTRDGSSMTISDGAGNVLLGAGNEHDPLYTEAKSVVLDKRCPSISLIQRHLRIGYNRAARLLEQMERDGIVSAINANGTREVIAA